MNIKETIDVLYRGGINGDVVNKFGENPDIDTTTDPEDIWYNGGLYVFPPTAGEAMELLSSSTDDDIGGIGALTVEISGVDESGDSKTQTFNMDGTTVVAIGDWSAINRMKVKTAGTTGWNIGTITVRKASAGATYATIGATLGQTLQAIYMTPNGSDMKIKRVYSSLNPKVTANATMSLFVINNGSRQVKHTWSCSSSQNYDHSFEYGGIIVAPGDKIFIRCNEVSASDVKIAAGFDIIGV